MLQEMLPQIFANIYKVAKSQGLAVRLTDVHLFSQSHNGSYFSHGFPSGSHSCVVFWPFLQRAHIVVVFFTNEYTFTLSGVEGN